MRDTTNELYKKNFIDAAIAYSYYYDKSNEELEKLLDKNNNCGIYLDSDYKYGEYKINFNDNICNMLEELYIKKISTVKNINDKKLVLIRCRNLKTNEAILFLKSKVKQKR